MILQINTLEGKNGGIGRISEIPGDAVGIKLCGIDDGPIGEGSFDITSAQDRMVFKSFLVRTPVKEADTGSDEIFMIQEFGKSKRDRPWSYPETRGRYHVFGHWVRSRGALFHR